MKKMNKKRAAAAAPHAILAALPLLALPLAATAQSSVTLGGQMKLGLDKISYTGGNIAGAPAANPGAGMRLTDHSSWWYVRGEEDLGGGTKAVFHFERSFAADTGAEGVGRFSVVGLSNPTWGRVVLGQWAIYFSSDAGLLTPNGIVDSGAYATGTLNVLGPIGAAGRYFSGGFLPNLIRYESPRWAGVAFTAAYAFDSETVNQSSNRTFNFNPTYINGPLALYWNYLGRNNQANAAGTFATTYDQRSNRLGAGWTFANGWRVAALWDRNEVEGAAVAGNKLSRDAWAIPVRYSTGPHTAHFTYGEARDFKTAGKTTPETGAKMISVGYEYALSKRTQVTTSWSTVRNDRDAAYDFWGPGNTLAKPANYTGFSSRYLYAGVRHLF